MQQNMSFFSSGLQEPNLDVKMPPFSCTDWVAAEVTLVTSKLFTGLGSKTPLTRASESLPIHCVCHSSHPAPVCLGNGTQGRGDRGQLLSALYKHAGAGGFRELPCFPSNFVCALLLSPCYCPAAF